MADAADRLDAHAAVLQGAGDTLVAVQTTLRAWADRLDEARTGMPGWTGKAAAAGKSRYLELAQACRQAAAALDDLVRQYLDAAKDLRAAARRSRIMKILSPILIVVEVVLTIALTVFAPGIGTLVGRAFGAALRAATTVAKAVVPAGVRTAAAGARAAASPLVTRGLGAVSAPIRSAGTAARSGLTRLGATSKGISAVQTVATAPLRTFPPNLAHTYAGMGIAKAATGDRFTAEDAWKGAALAAGASAAGLAAPVVKTSRNARVFFGPQGRMGSGGAHVFEVGDSIFTTAAGMGTAAGVGFEPTPASIAGFAGAGAAGLRSGGTARRTARQEADARRRATARFDERHGSGASNPVFGPIPFSDASSAGGSSRPVGSSSGSSVGSSSGSTFGNPVVPTSELIRPGSPPPAARPGPEQHEPWIQPSAGLAGAGGARTYVPPPPGGPANSPANSPATSSTGSSASASGGRSPEIQPASPRPAASGSAGPRGAHPAGPGPAGRPSSPSLSAAGRPALSRVSAPAGDRTWSGPSDPRDPQKPYSTREKLKELRDWESFDLAVATWGATQKDQAARGGDGVEDVYEEVDEPAVAVHRPSTPGERG